MSEKKKIIASVIGILLLLVMVVGVTYAMYTYTGTGSKENVITTGNISVSYAESKVVNLENTYPMSDALGIQGTESSEMKFTVTGNITGNVTINYAIGLDAIEEGASLKDEYVKIYMLKGSTVVSTFTEGVGTLISELEQNYVDGQLGSYALYTDSFTEEGITSQEYTLKAWVSEEYDLPGDDETRVGDTISKGTTSETFKFKIKVVATDQRLVIGNDNVGPTITSFTHLGDGVINVVATDASGLNGICINNNATDVTGCTWETYTTGTYEETLSTSGTYYAHLKDTIGNISHSNALGVLDISGANRPELATAMIPVYYDETCNSNVGCWRKADDTNSNATYKWYDYDAHMWANAVTVSEVDGSRTDLTDATLGTEIPMSRINTMLVWIPRFNAVTPTTPGVGNETVIDVTFVGTGTPALDAFTFGSQNLSGYWVGKFEVSNDVICTAANGSTLGNGCNLNTINPKVLPNVKSWTGAQPSTYYTTMLAMKSNTAMYGFNTTTDTTLDTHMMKNNEWGAVAYLTQSNYGRCADGICSEVWINPVNTLSGTASQYGPNITGCSGASVSAAMQNSMNACTSGYEYNGINNNGNSSTTGNVYGIYDMSGGAWDYVMGNFNSYSGNSATNNSGFKGPYGGGGSNTTGVEFPTGNNAKYINIYTGTSYQGHALSETAGWYSDISDLVSASDAWFVRGGDYTTRGNAAVFYFLSLNGNGSVSVGSRVSVTK